jgi:hypothetical protein
MTIGRIPSVEGGIQPTLLTAKGDLITATAASTVSRLGIGSTGQVLTVASGQPSWATPAASGGGTLLSTTTLSTGTTTISSISGSYRDLAVYVVNPSAAADYGITVRINGDTTGSNYQQFIVRAASSTNNTYVDQSIAGVDLSSYSIKAAANDNTFFMFFPNYANSSSKKMINALCGFQGSSAGSTQRCIINNTTYWYGTTAAISSLSFVTGSTFSGGTVYIYGVN